MQVICTSLQTDTSNHTSTSSLKSFYIDLWPSIPWEPRSWPTHTQKFKVNGQSVTKTEWKQTDTRTEAIVLPPLLMRSVGPRSTAVIFSSLLGVHLRLRVVSRLAKTQLSDTDPTVSDRVNKVQCHTRHMICHFRHDSFQAVNCTGTDNNLIHNRQK